MNVTEYINLCRVKRNISITTLAERLGKSVQTVSSKMQRNYYSVKDLEEYAKAMDATVEIRFIDNTTNKPII